MNSCSSRKKQALKRAVSQIKATHRMKTLSLQQYPQSMLLNYSQKQNQSTHLSRSLRQSKGNGLSCQNKVTAYNRDLNPEQLNSYYINTQALKSSKINIFKFESNKNCIQQAEKILNLKNIGNNDEKTKPLLQNPVKRRFINESSSGNQQKYSYANELVSGMSSLSKCFNQVLLAQDIYAIKSEISELLYHLVDKLTPENQLKQKIQAETMSQKQRQKSQLQAIQSLQKQNFILKSQFSKLKETLQHTVRQRDFYKRQLQLLSTQLKHTQKQLSHALNEIRIKQSQEEERIRRYPKNQNQSFDNKSVTAPTEQLQFYQNYQIKQKSPCKENSQEIISKKPRKAVKSKIILQQRQQTSQF